MANKGCDEGKEGGGSLHILCSGNSEEISLITEILKRRIILARTGFRRSLNSRMTNQYFSFVFRKACDEGRKGRYVAELRGMEGREKEEEWKKRKRKKRQGWGICLSGFDNVT